MKRKKVLSLILLIVAMPLAILYYLDNWGALSSISFTEVIFGDVEELAFLDSYAVKEPQPQYVNLNEIEEYYYKLVFYEQNEYLVAGYRFNNAKDALKFFQQDIKQEHFNEEFDPELMPFTWYSSHKNGVAVFGLIAQTDILLIESNTADLEELSQFQNWMASFLSEKLTA